MAATPLGDGLHGRKRPIGLAIVIGAGVLMGLVEVQHIREMSSTVGIAVFAVLPFLINIGLVAAGVWLARSRCDGDEVFRIAGWVLLGMGTIGLLATWTITHQNIRGEPFMHGPFVTVNNLSAGGLIGFAFGWYDVVRARHREQAETERARLDFIHSALRHNVLNGVNVILGRVDLLGGELEQRHRGHLEIIRDRGDELRRFTEATNALIENFLGKSTSPTRSIDLRTLLEQEIDKCRRRFTEAEFHLDLEEEDSFEGDDLASELFSNVLSNAVIHNDKPGPEVTVTAVRQNGSMLIRVADNGPGIPDAEKDRMLEWNVRGTDSPGTGLGLPIARTIARRYDGDLRLEDNEPEGTVVTIELPCTESSEV